MKSKSHHENAALDAAFSLANRKRWNKSIRASETAQIWHGWHFYADELIDSGGNRYSQNEIRAIFYTRRLLVDYREKLEKMRPKKKADIPIQLCLDLTPLWKMRAV